MPRETIVTAFWDYENQPRPKGQSFQVTWNRIRVALLNEFKIISQCWVFLNSNASDEQLRAEICNAGCSIVDCAPSAKGKTAQIDQRVIISMLTSAFGDSSQAVCLVSADGDYCHVLNHLRNHRVVTGLVYNTHGAALNPACAQSVDVCIGINFKDEEGDDEEDDDAERQEVDKNKLLFKCIQECPGTNVGSHKNVKLLSTVGTMFHAKMVHAKMGEKPRKRAFAVAKKALIEKGTIVPIQAQSSQYLRIP